MCDLRDPIQRHIYFSGAYEPIESYMFWQLVQPGMVVVDAGANIGAYALVAALKVGATGRVHAFEPVPRNFQLLRRHARDNRLTTVLSLNRVALWHRNEKRLRLSLRSDMKENSGAYSVGRSGEVVDEVTAEALRLDDYFADKAPGHVDFIKIDVEGAEWFALRGATQLISRCMPTLMVEINRETCRMAGYAADEIWNFLKEYGYRMWLISNSPASCRELPDLADVERANIICFARNRLPKTVTQGWSYKGILRFMRRGLGRGMGDPRAAEV